MVHRTTLWRNKKMIKRDAAGQFVLGTMKPGHGNQHGKNSSEKLFTQKEVEELTIALAKTSAKIMCSQIEEIIDMKKEFNEYRAMNKWRWWTVAVVGLLGLGVLAWISL